MLSLENESDSSEEDSQYSDDEKDKEKERSVSLSYVNEKKNSSSEKHNFGSKFLQSLLEKGKSAIAKRPEASPKTKKKLSQKIAPALSELTHMKGVHFHSFSEGTNFSLVYFIKNNGS